MLTSYHVANNIFDQRLKERMTKIENKLPLTAYFVVN